MLSFCISIPLILANILFWMIALCFSTFYAWKAVDIFVDTTVEIEGSKTFYGLKKDLRAWRFHQRWLNFVGSFVGWIALYYLIFIVISSFDTGNFRFEHIGMGIIAVLGITGLLPSILVKINSLLRG